MSVECLFSTTSRTSTRPISELDEHSGSKVNAHKDVQSRRRRFNVGRVLVLNTAPASSPTGLYPACRHIVSNPAAVMWSEVPSAWQLTPHFVRSVAGGQSTSH
jgi:hypothetical protein